MKKNKITVSVVLIVIVSLIIINQIVMRKLKSEIIIEASADEIWNVLLDHQAYPTWNPFIKQISGSTTVGETLEVTIQSEGNKPMAFKPLVLVNRTNEEFRWIGKLWIKGIFDGEHYFILEDLGSGQTKFIQGEKFKGILSGLMLAMIGKDTLGGFNAMNGALKEQVERN
ncbi:MAG: SRPBCC domain-containing protein [Anaerolineales bacterium]|nr:SRPBCC domain-containing protein [Anaerolineales bacterium]